jgi:hypothetical protein
MGTLKETASALAATVQRAHGHCQPTPCGDEGAAAPPVKRTAEQLERDVELLRKRLKAETNKSVFHAHTLTNALGQAEADRAQVLKQDQKDSRFEKGAAKPVDPKNKETWNNPSDQNYAVSGAKRSVLATVRYFSKGSISKAFDIVMALITAFGLEQRVRNYLDERTSSKTNAYIVQRLHEAVQMLKQCDSEEQRQQYRIVLTAIAPEKAERRDIHGMGVKVIIPHAQYLRV